MPGFDHGFNLGYGRRYTDADPCCPLVRAVDADTRRLAQPDLLLHCVIFEPSKVQVVHEALLEKMSR